MIETQYGWFKKFCQDFEFDGNAAATPPHHHDRYDQQSANFI